MLDKRVIEKFIFTGNLYTHSYIYCLQRLAKERDALKETMEELRCHISALTSPDTTASSRPPSDLSDVDLLDVVPHEVR